MGMEWKWATDSDSEVSMGQQSRDDGFFVQGPPWILEDPGCQDGSTVYESLVEKKITKTERVVMDICVGIKYSITC